MALKMEEGARLEAGEDDETFSSEPLEEIQVFLHLTVTSEEVIPGFRGPPTPVPPDCATLMAAPRLKFLCCFSLLKSLARVPSLTGTSALCARSPSKAAGGGQSGRGMLSCHTEDSGRLLGWRS